MGVQSNLVGDLSAEDWGFGFNKLCDSELIDNLPSGVGMVPCNCFVW